MPSSKKSPNNLVVKRLNARLTDARKRIIILENSLRSQKELKEKLIKMEKKNQEYNEEIQELKNMVNELLNENAELREEQFYE